MRVTPLVVWGSNLSYDDLNKVIVADVKMTHPSLVVQEAVFIYAVAI